MGIGKRILFGRSESVGGALTDAVKQLGGETSAQRRQRYDHQRKRNSWFSQYTEGEGTIEVFVDRHGEITAFYPHVHVIHDESRDEVRLVASRSAGDHIAAERLPGTASGDEVNDVVNRLRKLL
jgi:hypothetical protein